MALAVGKCMRGNWWALIMSWTMPSISGVGFTVDCSPNFRHLATNLHDQESNWTLYWRAFNSFLYCSLFSFQTGSSFTRDYKLISGWYAKWCDYNLLIIYHLIRIGVKVFAHSYGLSLWIQKTIKFFSIYVPARILWYKNTYDCTIEINVIQNQQFAPEKPT